MARVVANLSDQEIDNIVAFYTTQKSKPAENGQKLLTDITGKCNRCHAGDIAIRRWLYRSSMARTGITWFWHCGPIATASAKIP